MGKNPFVTIISGSGDWFNSSLDRYFKDSGIESNIVDIFSSNLRFYNIYSNSDYLINRVYTNEMMRTNYKLIKEIAQLLEVFNELDFLVMNPPSSYFYDISKMRTYLQLMKSKVPVPNFVIFENLSSLDNLKYPVVIKPNCSGKGYLTKIVKDRDEAEDFFLENRKNLQYDNFFIIQDYINTEENAVFRVENFGKLNVVLKMSYNEKFERTNKRVLSKYPNQVMEIAEVALLALDIKLGSVEILQDINKRFYVMDINPTSKFHEGDSNFFGFDPVKAYADYIMEYFEQIK